MAILQALLSAIMKSSGKILSALFGWAVRALFGPTTPKEQTMLSGLVAAAVAWPLLVFGVIAPKIATAVLAFVPLPDSVPSWIVRLVWIALALAVPVVVGLVVAAKAPPSMEQKSFVSRVLHGFPTTIALAAAFLFMFFTVPILRLVAIARRQKTRSVPLITETKDYLRVAEQGANTLRAHDFPLARREPPFWMTAPSKILLKLGGKAFREYMPQELAYYDGERLDVAFFPNAVQLRGDEKRITWAHGLLSEELVHSPALETVTPEAQALEKRVRRLWQLSDEHTRYGRAVPHLLKKQLDDVAVQLGDTHLPYDEWQVVYRQLLQLGRAFDREPQLLERTDEENGMNKDTSHVQFGAAGLSPEAQLSTGDLLREIAAKVTQLAKTEVELAKAEIKADVKAEVKMATGLGIAGLGALLTVNLLFVALALAIGGALGSYWAGALIVAGFTLLVTAVAGLVGWSKRVKNPMDQTIKTLKEDVQWTKERLA